MIEKSKIIAIKSWPEDDRPREKLLTMKDVGEEMLAER